MEETSKDSIKIISIFPQKLFSGNIHSYGLIYNNTFELSKGIITFTDVLEHKETVYYSEFENAVMIPKKDQELYPVWLTDIYGNFLYLDDNQRYLDFLKRFEQLSRNTVQGKNIIEKLKLTISKNTKLPLKKNLTKKQF